MLIAAYARSVPGIAKHARRRMTYLQALDRAEELQVPGEGSARDSHVIGLGLGWGAGQGGRVEGKIVDGWRDGWMEG
eukprot:1555023-Rhodomonas_salina.2